MNPKTLDVQNNFLNSASESALLSQYLLHSDDNIQYQLTSKNFDIPQMQNDNYKNDSPSLDKVQKFFRKNIKLRNATIRKNFWVRSYLSSSPIYLKISELIPLIQGTQGLILCIKNYFKNDNYEELISKVTSEVTFHELPPVENYNFINNVNGPKYPSTDENMIMNPKAKYDKNTYRKSKYKLVENVFMKLKKLKKEISSSKENFINNFISIKRAKNNIDEKCKVITIFPNINFILKKLKNISLSSQCKLNKILISRKNSQSLQNYNLSSGFITMSQEKRIITLSDDTINSDLKSSQNLKKIIFGIWINLKEEDISFYQSIDEVVIKHKYLIHRKCLEFLFASAKIETIFSPSPDEGIFLLLIFISGAVGYYEVKILPNEEEKNLPYDDKSANINEYDLKLENFNSQWLVLKREFSLNVDKGFELRDSSAKIDSVVNYVNYLNGIESKSNSQSKRLHSKSISSYSNTNNIQNVNENEKFIPTASVMNSKSNIKKEFLKTQQEFDPLQEIFESGPIANLKNDEMLNMNNNNVNLNLNVNPNANVNNNMLLSNIAKTPTQKSPYINIRRPFSQSNISPNFQRQNEFNELIESKPEILLDTPLANPSPLINHHVLKENQQIPIFTQSNVNHLHQRSINQFPKNQIPQSSHKKYKSSNNINFINKLKIEDRNNTNSNSNNEIQTQLYLNPNIVQKCDEAAQTVENDLNANSGNNMQIQNFNTIIREQSNNIKILQSKVNELESLLNKVTTILKKRISKCTCFEKKSIINDQNLNEIELSDEEEEEKSSESFKNSKSDSPQHLSKNNSINNNTNKNNSSSLLNISENANEKTIEVPQIKYNLTVLSNYNNEG